MTNAFKEADQQGRSGSEWKRWRFHELHH